MNEASTQEIHEAQHRIAAVTASLSQVFGTIRAGSILSGAALTALMQAYGPDFTKKFFQSIVDQIRTPETE